MTLSARLLAGGIAALIAIAFLVAVSYGAALALPWIDSLTSTELRMMQSGCLLVTLLGALAVQWRRRYRGGSEGE